MQQQAGKQKMLTVNGGEFWSILPVRGVLNKHLCKTELTISLWLTWAMVSALQPQMPPLSQYTGPGYVPVITLYTFLLQTIHYVCVVCYYVWFGT